MKENWKKLVDLGLRTSRVFTDNAMNVYSGYSAFYILMSLIFYHDILKIIFLTK